MAERKEPIGEHGRIGGPGQRRPPVAGPPDSAGSQGSFTEPDQLLTDDWDQQRADQNPPVHRDPARPLRQSPMRGAVWVLVALAVLLILAWYFVATPAN